MFVVLLACTGMEPEKDGGPATPPVVIPPDEVPPEGTPTVDSFASGELEVMPAFQGLVEVWGTAFLARHLDGTTTLGLAASGLAPATPHDVHLHTLPCAYDAGGHYLVDPTVPAGEDNEIRLPFTTDADGNGALQLQEPVSTRGDAMSVVIHDPASGSKLACADLLPSETVGSTASGTIAPFALAGPGDETIGGTASVVVTPSGTDVSLTLTGLDPAATYASHVHVQPCDVLDGSGHYKLDPLEELTLPENEIWLTPTPDAQGASTVTYDLPGHSLRADAQAVVIHRVDGAEVPKVACAELVHQDYAPLVHIGTAAPIGASTVTGSAELERRLDGVTVLTVTLAGLTPSGTHPVHLHRLPCAVLDGGGHTLLDPLLPEGEGNELWAEVVADAAGNASRAVGVTAIVGADAQSVVVHAADATKLACIDSGA